MCSCHKKKLIKVLEKLVSEVRMYRKLSFPISKPSDLAIGKTRVISEEIVDMKTYETFEQDLENLPEAIGADKDIDHAVLIVKADGVEISRTDVAFDLNTRKVNAPTPWKAPKGSDATLDLQYVDDDGNASPVTSFPIGIITDTMPPNAPSGTALGTTRATGEVEAE